MKQLSIVTESRLGLVAEITETLASNLINIENIEAKTFEDNALIILNVDNYDLAFDALKRFKNFQLITEDAILIKLKNEPGALAKIARRFTDASINLQSIRFVQRGKDSGLVAVSTDNPEVAQKLIKDVLVT